MTAVILKSLVLLAVCVTLNGQRITIMMPTTTTKTLTSTTTAKTNCFKVNGPVTPCRKRRQFWVEEPIILMAQPELFIQPTNPFRVEPTAVPMDWLENNQFYSGFHNRDAYLHPSIPTPANNYMNFVNLDNLFRNNPIQRQSTRTTKRTIMYTRTKTVTENETTTKTNSIAISGCTPSPLPYDVCA